MRKIIIFILLLIPAITFSQSWQWWWTGKTGERTPFPSPEFVPVIPVGIVDTSTIPPVPYTDLYLDVQPHQVLRYWSNFYTEVPSIYSFIMNSTTANFEIGFDMKCSFPDNSTLRGVFGYNYVSGIQNLYAYLRYDTLKLQIHDTIYVLGYINSTNGVWHTYKLKWNNPVLSFDKDGVEICTRPTAFADTVSELDSSLAFTFGGAGMKYNASYVELGLADFTGGFDNIYFVTAGDTISNTNFNDGGGTSQPLNKEWWWKGTRSQDAHGTYDDGGWLGYVMESYSGDYFTPQFMVRTGTRKDTCKYYSVPSTDTAGDRGVQFWSSAVDILNPIRSACNKLLTKPTDYKTVLVIGSFNTHADTTLTLSKDVCLIRNDSLISLGTGLGVTDYGYNGVWAGDNIYITHGGDSAGGKYSPQIVKCNTLTGVWDSLGATANYPVSIGLQQGLKYFHDTLWVMAGVKYLYAYDPSNQTWALTDSFDTSRKPAWWSVPDLWTSPDSMWCAVSGMGVYQMNGGRKTLVSAIPDTFDLNSWYSSSCYDSVTGRIYFGNVQYHENQLCQGLSYYKNGTVTNLVAVDSNDMRNPIIPDPFGGTNGYMRPAVFATTIWQGEVIATGQFKLVDGKKMINIFQWDSVRGTQPLDYGTEWNSFGITTYQTADNYVDLLVCGDWVSAGGVRFNHVAGRYSEAHFQAIKPEINALTNLPDSIYEAQYPNSYTYKTYSPTRRGITPVVKFKKGINGSLTNITPSKTDSTLDANLRGYWMFTYSATMTGTVAGGDTIYYYEVTTDDLGNVDSSTAKTMRIITDPTEVVSGLSYAWNYDTLTISPVTTWINTVDTLAFRQGTASYKPTLNSGIVFDTISGLNAQPDTTKLSHSWSVVLVMKLVDTNTTDNQFVFTSNTNSGTLANVLAFKVQTNGTASRLKYGIGYNNGAGYTYRTYPTTTGNAFNTWSVFIITADSTNKQNLYVNGVTGVNGGVGYTITSYVTGINLGWDFDNTQLGMKNSIIRIVKIFPRVLTATELTQEYWYQYLNNCQ